MTRKFSSSLFLPLTNIHPCGFPGSTKLHLVRIKDRWLSGRKRSPAKGVYPKRVSRVRIPPDPPLPDAGRATARGLLELPGSRDFETRPKTPPFFPLTRAGRGQYTRPGRQTFDSTALVRNSPAKQTLHSCSEGLSHEEVAFCVPEPVMSVSHIWRQFPRTRAVRRGHEAGVGNLF